VTDAELISRAAKGDQTAFEVLYERHWKAVYSYAWLLARSVPIAEDITQECFLALLRKPLQFDSARVQLRTWLIAVVRRQYWSRCRRSSREEAFEDSETPDTTPGVEGELLQMERAEAVRQALAALPEPQREALYLFEFEGLSLAETAGILNIDANAVKARLHRGRAQLKRLLAPVLGIKIEVKERL